MKNLKSNISEIFTLFFVLFLFIGIRLISIFLHIINNLEGLRFVNIFKTIFKNFGLLASGHEKLS